ncbi:hypothetical protein CANARDRAFT_8647 [[Candida] arabinofermentans NRRL YB-2248]|uniref:DUF1748-domain-containing protein n=1 Tax=[Candida] arabinofermentans NRRL YB-2248 TaxID=983967 RepID=A0A1E4SXS0_9ASCO|nr:hypothetical protein CANARDRAFT_8647 [[Candida] arabinofermentans NRRL YB-2248]
MSMISKLVHASIDLALLSGFLAGVKHSTGLTPKVSLINQPQLEIYADKYLDMGDYLYFGITQYMSGSEYFTRK